MKDRMSMKQVDHPMAQGLRPGLTAASLVVALYLAGCVDFRNPPIGTEANQFQTRLSLGDDLQRSGDFASALQIYTDVLESASSDRQRAEVLHRLGDIYLRTNQIDLAVAAFREKQFIAPNDVTGLTGLGIALILKKKFQEAEDFLSRAVSNGDARAYSPLGVALDNQGRHIEAQEVYQRGLRVSPSSKTILSNLALSYALSGNYAEAINTSNLVTRNLTVSERFKRNEVLIYFLAGQSAAAQQRAQLLGMATEDVAQISQIAAQINGAPGSQRQRPLSRFTL